MLHGGPFSTSDLIFDKEKTRGREIKQVNEGDFPVMVERRSRDN